MRRGERYPSFEIEKLTFLYWQERLGGVMVQIDYDMIVFREGDSYVGYCPELDVFSCGHDTDEARSNLKTAVRLFLEECTRMGTLDQVLQEAGYTPDGMGGYISPRVIATESASLAVES